MTDQRWWRSTIARRICQVGAWVFFVLAVLTTRLSVADSFTGQLPWASHWVTTVVLGVGAFTLGALGFFGDRGKTTEQSAPPAEQPRGPAGQDEPTR